MEFAKSREVKKARSKQKGARQKARQGKSPTSSKINHRK